MNQFEKFLREINRAFSEGDTQYLLENVTDDFCWFIVGEKTVSGKTEFSEALEQMRQLPPMKIEIDNIIMEGNSASVEGKVTGRNKNGQKKHFGFCDLYRVTNPTAPKISEMTSFVIDLSKHKLYKESC